MSVTAARLIPRYSSSLAAATRRTGFSSRQQDRRCRTTDLTKLLDREPHHRFTSPVLFPPVPPADLSSYSVLVNLITEPEQNCRVLENEEGASRSPGRVVKPPKLLRSTRDQWRAAHSIPT